MRRLRARQRRMSLGRGFSAVAMTVATIICMILMVFRGFLPQLSLALLLLLAEIVAGEGSSRTFDGVLAGGGDEDQRQPFCCWLVRAVAANGWRGRLAHMDSTLTMRKRAHNNGNW